MRPLRNILVALIAGAIMFWVPSALWHLVRGDKFGGLDAIGLTILLPFSLFALARAIQRRVGPRAAHWLPIAVCLGVWVLGPLYLIATFPGDLDVTVHGVRVFPLMFIYFPATTFAVASRDSTLFALGFTTIFLIAAAISGAPSPRRLTPQRPRRAPSPP